ncbi:hypothetical protein HMPREF9406_2658 [Clostridium sp. HGF2]|nr:hypothetical protein HMPREF9406_2658 [Clostridium sp. HGF2]
MLYIHDSASVFVLQRHEPCGYLRHFMYPHAFHRKASSCCFENSEFHL